MPAYETVLSTAQIHEFLEKACQDRRQMGAQELVDAYHAQTLYDPPEVSDILGFASLLPEDDPLFVAS